MVAFAALLLAGFALSFWMLSQSMKVWSIILSLLIGGLFVYWAATNPQTRYASAFFALLAFGFAMRGWRDRRAARARAAGAE